MRDSSSRIRSELTRLISGASEQTGGQVAAPIAAAVMQRALAPPAEAGHDDQDSQQDGGSGDGG